MIKDQENTVSRDYWVIGLSLLIAALLQILPLPHALVWARPQWMYMVLIYWVMTTPYRIGVGIAWLIGILMDLLTGTLLGQQAFIYAAVAYLLITFHPRLAKFPLWQQALMVFILAMLNLAMQYVILSLAHKSAGAWTYWLSALTSVVIWPWLFLVLQECRLRFRMV